MVKKIQDTPRVDPTPPPRNVIRPLYGVFIGDDLRQFRTDLQDVVDQLQDALDDGDPEVSGAKDRRLAESAIRGLEEAIEELKIGDPKKRPKSAPPAEPKMGFDTRAPSGDPVIRPLYGVFIRDTVEQATVQVKNEIEEIKAAQKMKRIPPGEADDVKRALSDLQRVVKKLEKIKNN